jgi:hypothetical protein
MGMGPPARGRVFLPPASLPQELHVNIGHFMKGLQAYHEYESFMEHAISKDDYDEMMGKVKAFMEANACHTAWEMLFSCTTMCGLCCFTYAYVYMYKYGKVTKGLQQIVGEYAGASLKLYKVPVDMPQNPDAMGFDSTGAPPTAIFGRDEDGYGGYSMPCWPPTGYHIVLKAPGEGKDLRAAWPKFSMGGGEFAQSGGHRVVEQSNEDAPLEKIKKLKSLLDAGALSQAEFDQKKAELMEKI